MSLPAPQESLWNDGVALTRRWLVVIPAAHDLEGLTQGRVFSSLQQLWFPHTDTSLLDVPIGQGLLFALLLLIYFFESKKQALRMTSWQILEETKDEKDRILTPRNSWLSKVSIYLSRWVASSTIVLNHIYDNGRSSRCDGNSPGEAVILGVRDEMKTKSEGWIGVF